jgi:acetyltransferase-like isoleucine patch superfamily enzyme
MKHEYWVVLLLFGLPVVIFYGQSNLRCILEGRRSPVKRYRDKSPEEVMKMVTTEIIIRGIKLGRKKKRTIYISKSSGGKGIDINTLDPATEEGRKNLAAFLTPVKKHYTISGLGAPEEKNAINWRVLNVPLWRRILLVKQVAISMLLKGSPFKNRFYRWMGVHVGKNTEIMLFVWLDHFRPELIFIGDNTLIGAFSRVTVHAYEGCGRFRFGLVEIGSNCTLGAGTGLGVIKIEDNVRTLPGATLSPYLLRIKAGSVVGWNPPKVQEPQEENPAE